MVLTVRLTPVLRRRRLNLLMVVILILHLLRKHMFTIWEIYTPSATWQNGE